jgi:hypothetical protein
MEGLENFTTSLNRAMKDDLDKLFKSKKKSKLLMKEIHKHIFDLGEPTPVSKRTLRQTHLSKVFDGYFEILKSLDVLCDIEFYISRFPYRTAFIPKHGHLQFYAEAYLHEVYVLEQRLLAFLKVLERAHRKDAKIDAIKDLCDLLRGFVLKTFKKMHDLRGGHVTRRD